MGKMPRAPLKITVLGSGTSMGVPTLGCPCRVCGSTDSHDNRLRPTILLSRNGRNFVIDPTPDFRQQAMRAGLDRLDAILLTHGHADHVLGFDDIRPYNIRQRAALPVYGNEDTFQIIRRIFAYVFDDKPTQSTVPSVTLKVIDDRPFELLGIPHVQLAYDGLQFEVRVDATGEPLRTHKGFEEAHPTAGEGAPRFSTFPSSEAWASRFGKFGHRSVLAIGSFDGIHLGHQAILRSVAARGRALNAVPTALTFDPSPRKVLRPDEAPLQLSTIAQRLAGFSALGLEAAVVLPFTLELSRLTPEEFVEQMLLRDLCIKALFVGENFRFGHKQAGDVNLLRKLGAEHGFEVVVLPPVIYRGEIVSSTLIRKEIAEGNVSRAARLLGRQFALTGEVIPGTGTGHRFTFPTLNLALEQELLPRRGVYITRTCLDGEQRSRRSVTNVGMRPTFNGSALSVETHGLDWHPAPNVPPASLPAPSGPDIAATFRPAVPSPPKRIEVRFWERLRDEKKFSGPEDLRAQITRDIANANKFFSRLHRFRSIRSASASASHS